MTEHQSVLQREVVEAVDPAARRIIDATVGAGGHAAAMLSRATKAELLGIDQDESMLIIAKLRLLRFADRVNLILGNFRDITAAAADIGWTRADAILFDLGIASVQLADPDRGLSFQTDSPLDMRLDREQDLTAARIVNTWREHDLLDLFRRLGEEPFARTIARSIVDQRRNQPLTSTVELARTIDQAIPARERYRRKIHPATNVFRALRMTVNDELGALQAALPQATELLSPGGKLLVVSFHSLEDRPVKQFMRSAHSLTVLTKKPITPSTAEVALNPRARSAKLRIAIKRDTG